MTIPVSEGLLLRSYVPADAAALLAVVQGSRAHLRPFLTWVDTMQRVEDAVRFIEGAIAHQERQSALFLGLFQDGELIGGASIHEWDHYLDKAETGYWLAKEYEGRGIMLPCVKAIIRFGFEQLRLNKIELRIVSHNTRSIKLMQQLGCKTEGILRQNIKLNGRLEDVVVAGLLRSEWLIG